MQRFCALERQLTHDLRLAQTLRVFAVEMLGQATFAKPPLSGAHNDTSTPSILVKLETAKLSAPHTVRRLETGQYEVNLNALALSLPFILLLNYNHGPEPN